MKKKLFLLSILILTVLFSVNLSAQFLRWNWWKQNPALSLIGFNTTLNPIRSGGAVSAEGTFTPGFGYRSLLPSNLTSRKGISVTQSDNLQYTRGSLQGGDGAGTVFENFDGNQGTLECWVRPNWNGNDGLNHIILDTGSVTRTTGQILLVKNSSSLLDLSIMNVTPGGSGIDVSSLMTAGNWYHIVAVWDANKAVSGNNRMKVYLNNSNTWEGKTTNWSPTAPDSTIKIGRYPTDLYNFNGVIAGRILNRPLTSTEVSTNYASGAGHTDTFTVTPDTVWMGTFSD